MEKIDSKEAYRELMNVMEALIDAQDVINDIDDEMIRDHVLGIHETLTDMIYDLESLIDSLEQLQW